MVQSAPPMQSIVGVFLEFPDKRVFRDSGLRQHFWIMCACRVFLEIAFLLVRFSLSPTHTLTTHSHHARRALGGELFRVIAVDPLPEEKARGVVFQILEGVRHLHTLNIVHMDLKVACNRATWCCTDVPNMSIHHNAYIYCSSA